MPMGRHGPRSSHHPPRSRSRGPCRPRRRRRRGGPDRVAHRLRPRRTPDARIAAVGPRTGASVEPDARCLPAVPLRQLLAHRRPVSERPPAVGRLASDHRGDQGPQGRLRVGHLGRRTDRHPVHPGRRRPAEGPRVVRLPRRERPGALPDPRRCAGRARLGPPRDRRRRVDVSPLRDLRLDSSARRVLDRGVRRDLGPALERPAPRGVDLRGCRRTPDPGRPGPI